MGGLEAGVTLVLVEDADLSRCTLVRCCHCTFACGSLVSLSAPVLALGAIPCWLGSRWADPVPPWEAPGSVLLSTPVLGMWSVMPGVSRGALIQPPSWPVSVHLGLRAACPHSAVLSTLGGTEVGLVSLRCSSRLPGLDSGSCSADPHPLPSHADVFSPDFAAPPPRLCSGWLLLLWCLPLPSTHLYVPHVSHLVPRIPYTFCLSQCQAGGGAHVAQEVVTSVPPGAGSDTEKGPRIVGDGGLWQTGGVGVCPV